MSMDFCDKCGVDWMNHASICSITEIARYQRDLEIRADIAAELARTSGKEGE